MPGLLASALALAVHGVYSCKATLGSEGTGNSEGTGGGPTRDK